ncbi:hypothetical protein OIU84_000103 [Salix udensis]|uniref:Uncharacterized protein n=1 Tax=Salix udensis TaxID=889485 RepID=A0AAD6L3U5_9ROSI|nr:hypothetical protein OIU84_000103 [Salix udensis]
MHAGSGKDKLVLALTFTTDKIRSHLMRCTCFSRTCDSQRSHDKKIAIYMYENSLNQTNLLFHFQTNHCTIKKNMHYQFDLSRMRKKHDLGKMGFSFQDQK